MSLDSLFRQLGAQTIPPLERWNPAFCGDMDLRITVDGAWIHEGTPIRRPALIQLLSSVLRREADGHYYLVTPTEKLRIEVEDLPLLVTDADEDEHGWTMVTQEGDRVRLDASHRLRLVPAPDGELLPALPVRHGLEARLHRNLFYRLAGIATRQGDELGIVSHDIWHPLGRLDDGVA